MSSLKKIKGRIKTISGIKQITTAVKMVANSKLKKTQKIFENNKVYLDKIETVFQNLDFDDFSPYFSKTVENSSQSIDRRLIVILTADRGLCGGFVSGTLNYYKKIKKDNDKIFVLGKRGLNYFKNYEENWHQDIGNLEDYKSIFGMANKILDEFKTGKYSKVIVIMNKFKNIMIHNLIEYEMLPLTISGHKEYMHTIEPKNKKSLLTIGEKYIREKFFNLVIENAISEYAERMIVMNNAMKDTQEMIDKARRDYNRERQRCVTEEIIEIISASNALNC